MKVKKLILLTSLMSSTAIAADTDFYIRLKLSHMQPEVVHGLKSKAVILPGFAVGYHVSDDIRVDLSMSHISNMKHIGTVTQAAPAPIDPDAPPPPFNACDCPPLFVHKDNKAVLRTKLTTCKLNLFADLYKFRDMSFYIGAGVGATRAQRSLTIDKEVEKTKAYYTMSYDIHAGINRKIREDASVGIGYTFKNLTENTYNYKGHSFSTSINIDL